MYSLVNDIGNEIRPPRTQSLSVEGAEPRVAETRESGSRSRSRSRVAHIRAIETGEPSSRYSFPSRQRNPESLLGVRGELEVARRELEELRRKLSQERYYRQREVERERPSIIQGYDDSSDESNNEWGTQYSRNRPHSRSPSISSDEAELVSFNVYDFRLSCSPSVAQSVSGEGGPDRETTVDGSKEDSTSKTNPQTSSPNTSLHVYESQYAGDAFIDGSHSARLTIVQDPKRQRQPLFRWLHLKQAVLNLDQLLDEITRDPELNDNDRSLVVKLLAEVRKNSKSKQKADGSHVKYTPPTTLWRALPSDDSGKSQPTYRRWMAWICIPYFSLQEYSGLLSSKNPAAYPNQTLWQAMYSGNTQERDMQQVVCQMNKGSISPKHCFHISQLWAIVVDTCE